MGCCSSCFSKEPTSEKDNIHKSTQRHSPSNGKGAAFAGDGGGVPVFSEYSLADLKAATNNFSSEFIVSESGEKAPNVVYKGRLQNRRWIAVKKFSKMAWPDPKQFAVSISIYYYCFDSGIRVYCLFERLGFTVIWLSFRMTLCG